MPTKNDKKRKKCLRISKKEKKGKHISESQKKGNKKKKKQITAILKTFLAYLFFQGVPEKL